MKNQAEFASTPHIEDDWQILGEAESAVCSEIKNDIDDDNTIHTESEVVGGIRDDESTVGSIQQEHRQDHALPEAASNDIGDLFMSTAGHGSNDAMRGCTKAQRALGLPLLQAIKDGYERLAIKLIDSGADPNVKDSCGYALTQAIRGGYESLATLLAGGEQQFRSRNQSHLALVNTIDGVLSRGTHPDIAASYGVSQIVRMGNHGIILRNVSAGSGSIQVCCVLSGDNTVRSPTSMH